MKMSNYKKETLKIIAIVLGAMISISSLLSYSLKAEEVKNDEFKDWQKICNETSNTCSIFSFGFDSEGNKKARVSLSLYESADNKKVAEMTILSPLYSYLPHGLLIAVQNNEPIRHEFALCAKEGCLNFIPLQKEEVEMLKKEWNLVLGYQDYRNPNEQIILDVSLVGFKKAYESLTN